MMKLNPRELALDLVSAVIWAALIIVIVLFSNVSITQFIYNKF